MPRSSSPPRPTVRLSLVPPRPADAGGDPEATGRRVAAEVVAVLGGVSPEVLASAPLALPLALSVPMARHGLSADELTEAMRALRGAILALSSLDPATEPSPLPAGDARRAALTLAGYLHDLLLRAARRIGTAPGVLAAAAAAHLLAAETSADHPVPSTPKLA